MSDRRYRGGDAEGTGSNGGRYSNSNMSERSQRGRSNASGRLRQGESLLEVRPRNTQSTSYFSNKKRAGIDQPISRRGFFYGILAAGGIYAAGMLASHDIFWGEQNIERANARRLLPQTLYAKRGTVYDRSGNVIVASAECKNIYLDATQITKKKVEKVVSALVDVLGVDEETVRENAKSGLSFVYVKRQVDQEDADTLADMNLPGVGFEESIKRVYPYQNLAAQVVGVVNTDNEGTTGLESYYEDVLQGTNGSIVRERAQDGSYIAGGAYSKTDAIDGQDLVLTLDVNIQRVAEEALARGVQDTGAEYGSAVVIDPATGDILAACSYPTFDPSDLSNARFEDMNLRLVTDTYEPGSVFKPLVVCGGIEAGAFGANDTFEIPASTKVGDNDVTDDDNRNYGMTMDPREILRRSSNVGAAILGQKMSAESFDEHVIKCFRIGQKMDIDFPGEITGIVKEPADYDGSSVGSMSFGQGLSVPPIEIARATCAIASGGSIPVPHFLKSKAGVEKNWKKKCEDVISSETAQAVASMMTTVVESGTGTNAQIAGYEVAGKTGTAEQASSEGGYRSSTFMSSFVGFAPASDPKVLVYVTLDKTPQHGSSAATPFATIMSEALSVLGIPSS